MNDTTQAVFRDRIIDVVTQMDVTSSDMHYPIKKIDQELFTLYSDVSSGRDFFGKKHTSKDLMHWLRYGREMAENYIKCLHELTDIIDEIEDEIRKDEVNIAG